MKIAITSDIHDNLANLEKVLSWCEQEEVKKMICCGDITNSETLSILAQQFSGQIYLVQGNAEIYEEQETKKFANIVYLGKYGYFPISSEIMVGICHEPAYIARVMALMQEPKTTKMIFYGHTHQPWEETKEGIRILNPGTVAGTFSKPTFAAWETETNNIELIRLELI